jgi:CRISPR-associated protein Csm5
MKVFQASNRYAAELLNRHKQYATWSGLARLGARIAELEARVAEIGDRQDACLMPIGWGGGLLGKSAYLETQDESYRKILKNIAAYERVMQTGLPFPKTRRVIFENGHPASLPGWILLQLI